MQMKIAPTFPIRQCDTIVISSIPQQQSEAMRKSSWHLDQWETRLRSIACSFWTYNLIQSGIGNPSTIDSVLNRRQLSEHPRDGCGSLFQFMFPINLREWFDYADWQPQHTFLGFVINIIRRSGKLRHDPVKKAIISPGGQGQFVLPDFILFHDIKLPSMIVNLCQ